MEKVLISENYGPVIVTGNNYCFGDSDGVIRDCYYIENDSEVFINGELKYTAKAGDAIVRLYGVKDRYCNYEYCLIPGSIFGDYFTRLKAEKETRPSKKYRCNDCESICCNCEAA